MKFTPETYNIKDVAMTPYIDSEEIWDYINNTIVSKKKLENVIKKSLSKKRLNLEDVAVLVNTDNAEMISMIKKAAAELKENVYGNRIVLFAPLYIGNLCSNNCKYCGFQSSNVNAVRKTLNKKELEDNVKFLLDNGQKRLILVYGEHRTYSAEYIADTVKTVYNVKSGNSTIRRVNINAAPMEIEGYKTVLKVGIGTFQVFQETYHRETYKKYHISGKKADYENRLIALDKAQEAGLDDVGIGALFGLYDWRFEVLSLVRHTNHLEACYNVGPHTISFPRLQDASKYDISEKYKVNDEDFTKLVAILRLAVPYTGLILTAREPAEIRREVLQYGCSQVDAGTKIELGAYSNEENKRQDLTKEQFLINDSRSLNEVIDELIENNYMPSFCTACYRKGRTGEHFMEFSVPGFIKRFCTPNAILTLSEYIVDYADKNSSIKAWKLIEKNISGLKEEKLEKELKKRIERIKSGERDLYF
ncbi:MAG: [FeFe] hydrogenase H-cluster radical SAM maturase HydG [Bacteroidales bacterium]|nr:[FeFe] hydrogenase H-cluster radical SAM maturase HydG [Bacteroidales bacterium]